MVDLTIDHEAVSDRLDSIIDDASTDIEDKLLIASMIFGQMLVNAHTEGETDSAKSALLAVIKSLPF